MVANAKQNSKYSLKVVDGFIDIFENGKRLKSTDWFISHDGEIVLTNTKNTIGININNY